MGQPVSESFDETGSDSQCFVLLNDQFTAADWERQMPTFVKKHKPKDAKTDHFPIQPLSDIHFATAYGGVSKGLITSLLIIGIFLILTACINFVNLATAQALTRSREVGVRKVMGSTQGQLFAQFMGETSFITLAATTLGIGIFWAGLSLVQQYLSGAFKFTFSFNLAVVG
ncbi:MAG: FtsX-like permease family protein [Bacteroidetes bacterium]|nr:FtsX-like permease family protein [Fibrella sp.]